MAALRDIKNKIKGVNKTRQITRAMNMVAAAKLRGVQTKTLNFRPYAEKFTDVLSRLCQGLQSDAHPLLVQYEEVRTVALILLTAERGMCGAFNNNLIAEAGKFIKEQTAQGRKVRIYCIGGKGRNFFSKNFPQHYKDGRSGDLGEMSFDATSKIAYYAVRDFINREIEEAYLIYSNYRSLSSQAPLIEKLLPITPPPQTAETKTRRADYIIEPSAAALVEAILPLFINVRVYHGLLETATGEQAARMVAMDNATKNCKEMIDSLTTLFNKARQSAITTELIDIVSGADAVSA
jgi:F-type H+-transporting ATPase subunit gamma